MTNDHAPSKSSRSGDSAPSRLPTSHPSPKPTRIRTGLKAGEGEANSEKIKRF